MIKLVRLIKKLKWYGFKDFRGAVDYILHQEDYDFIAELMFEFYMNEMNSENN